MSDQIKGLCFALLAMLGGGLYAIPYHLSLETVDPLPVIWGVFFWAFLFSLPGAWLARQRTNFSWKTVNITLLTSLAGLLGNYSIIENEILIITKIVNSKTGETIPLIKKQYNLDAKSAAFDIANDLSEKIFNHLQKDKVKNSR